MLIHLNSSFLNRWARITLIAGLCSSGLIAWQLHVSNERRINSAVTEAFEQANHAVRNRIDLYQYGLSGARGAVLSAGEHSISRELFQRYSRSRDTDREFPGARGFGFIRRVPQADEAEFVERSRADLSAIVAGSEPKPADEPATAKALSVAETRDRPK
ncbi:CHASE domain-containing protein [Marinobacter sp. SS21]|uniref:CHASE domain-containing protein n=1 Tax=Marinobacter sp. SS21 TaxID=2979460 RepID=UPI00232AEB4D|nr:CHASE domain-containing protein [Marinobacter sp. SS21]MDC0663130.1 CHASE domain-containing protein [Marinobacter sp. SS21]